MSNLPVTPQKRPLAIMGPPASPSNCMSKALIQRPSPSPPALRSAQNLSAAVVKRERMDTPPRQLTGQRVGLPTPPVTPKTRRSITASPSSSTRRSTPIPVGRRSSIVPQTVPRARTPSAAVARRSKSLIPTTVPARSRSRLATAGPSRSRQPSATLGASIEPIEIDDEESPPPSPTSTIRSIRSRHDSTTPSVSGELGSRRFDSAPLVHPDKSGREGSMAAWTEYSADRAESVFAQSDPVVPPRQKPIHKRERRDRREGSLSDRQPPQFIPPPPTIPAAILEPLLEYCAVLKTLPVEQAALDLREGDSEHERIAEIVLQTLFGPSEAERAHLGHQIQEDLRAEKGDVDAGHITGMLGLLETAMNRAVIDCLREFRSERQIKSIHSRRGEWITGFSSFLAFAGERLKGQLDSATVNAITDSLYHEVWATEVQRNTDSIGCRVHGFSKVAMRRIGENARDLARGICRQIWR